jgi:hypothetical protein
LHVALLGGTGVGKSMLFNALLGRPEASPTSDAVRVYTRKPHVAVAAHEQPFVSVPDALQPVFVEGGIPGVVLCDTPDVDGMLQENRAVTRELIEHCDVVVFVTDPDKRGNFDVLQEVHDWAARKRWFFVMNKMDAYDQRMAEIGADFDKKLHGLGFEPTEACRFLISATSPQRYHFRDLRAAVLCRRSEDQLALLRVDAFLGYAVHALQPETLNSLEETAHTLERAELGLRQRIHQAYLKGLEKPEAAEAFRWLAREGAWRHLGQQCGWFMALPIWIRCRFSLLWTGYQVSLLSTRGPAWLGVLGAAASSLVAGVRSLLPLRQIVTALGPLFRRTLAEVRADARRTLEDHGLIGLATASEAEAASKAEADLPAAVEGRHNPPARSMWDKVLHRLMLPRADDELVAQLEADLDCAGRQTARQVVQGVRGWCLVLVSNLIPAGILGWIVCRLGTAWWSETYLSMPFYGMALALMVAAFLPGCWLLSWAITRRGQGLNLCDLVQQVDEPGATAALRGAHQRLDRFLQQARQLRQALDETRQTLERERGLLMGLQRVSHGNGPEQLSRDGASVGRL